MEQVQDNFRIIMIILMGMIAFLSIILVVYALYQKKKSDNRALIISVLVVGTTVGILGSIVYLIFK